MTLEELDILERRVANYADRFVLAIQESRKTDAEFIKAGMVEAARRIKAERAILDGEAVAVGSDGRPMAFQEILKRFRRKYHVAKLAKEIPLRLFLFDLIYLEGESLADRPLKERRALLEGCLLYTSDAADDLHCVDLGGRRLIKKKKNKHQDSDARYGVRRYRLQNHSTASLHPHT